MSKLKPCPFCGCKNIYVSKSPYKHGYYVVCSDGNCSASLHAYGKRSAYTAWNQRKGPIKEVIKEQTQIRKACCNCKYSEKFDAAVNPDGSWYNLYCKKNKIYPEYYASCDLFKPSRESIKKYNNQLKENKIKKAINYCSKEK